MWCCLTSRELGFSQQRFCISERQGTQPLAFIFSYARLTPSCPQYCARVPQTTLQFFGLYARDYPWPFFKINYSTTTPQSRLELCYPTLSAVEISTGQR